MALFGKKDNGINWQKEVYETGKVIPTILKQLEIMGKSFDSHEKESRTQRIEDKLWQDEILKNSLDCARGEQIDKMQTDVDTLKSDKVESTGKFLGMKRIWVICIAVGVVAMLALNIMWKLGML